MKTRIKNGAKANNSNLASKPERVKVSSNELKAYIKELTFRYQFIKTLRDHSPKSKKDTIKCSICGREISNQWSNNAEPINNGRCCSHCNCKYVIPARIYGEQGLAELVTIAEEDYNDGRISLDEYINILEAFLKSKGYTITRK